MNKQRKTTLKLELDGLRALKRSVRSNPPTVEEWETALAKSKKVIEKIHDEEQEAYEKTIDKYDLDLSGRICADIGASTGGFTDCMLQNNASKVYAVDVGYGQLAWSLRNDERVVCLERTNARYLNETIITDKLDFFSMDVSFISVRLILPALYPLLNDHANGVILIKPQFEAGKGKVGKNGVVRDPEIHKEVLKEITDYLIANDYAVIGLDYSPIKGPKGNIEYLAFVEKSGISNPFDINNLVAESHMELNRE